MLHFSQDLKEVVSQAREAQVLEPTDDYFVDEEEPVISQMLTQTQLFRK